MVCKSCGTKLIRGYAFCMNCGTPVPPGAGDEDDNMPPANDLFANANGDNDTESGGSEEGTLVFCPACGMHMQKDPYRCEKCGMIIRENIHSDNPQRVPAFNPNADVNELGGGIGGFGIGADINGGMTGIGGGMASIGGGMASIGGGMGSIGGGMGSIGGNMTSVGGSMASIGGGMESIGGGMASNTAAPPAPTPNMFNTSNNDELSALAGFSVAPGNIMPSIDTPDQPNIIHQKEPEKGQERKMEDFSMSDIGNAGSMMQDNTVPVIEGCSMDEDTSKDVELDPYKFLNNSMGDMLVEEPQAPAAQSVLTSEPVAPAVAATIPEPITMPAPIAVEPVVPIITEPAAPVAQIMPEPIAPPIVEPVAPIAEIMPEPIAPPIVEPVAPVAEITPEPIAPPIVEPVAPVTEITPESIAPPIVEPVAPVAEITPEPIAPPIVEPVAPVAEIMPEPIAPPIVEPVAPVAEIMPEPIAPPIIEPVAPVAEIMPEPIAPPIVEPVAPVAEIMPEPIAPPIVEPIAVAPVNDFVPEERGFITESNPLISETAQPKAQTASPTATAVLPDPITESVSKAVPPLNRPDTSTAGNGPDASKGKLVYCRNCGQDMYDTEKVCKNCGAPYKGAYVPPKNAPSRGKSNEPKKIFGIFAPSVFAGIIVTVIAVIALAIFIGIRTSGPKTPEGGGHTAAISTSSDNQSVDTASANNSSVPPVQSTDDTSTNEDPTSSDDPTSSEDTNPNSSAGGDTPSSSSTPTPISSSSTKPQSSSAKPQSSTKPQSSSTPQSTPIPANQMTAKVKSLEADRVKIMNAIEKLSSEMGKINAMVLHANYELDTTKITKATTLKNFYESSIGSAFLTSIRNNRYAVLIQVDNAAPSNSELNSLYESLKTLRSRYNDCFNLIDSPGDANKFKDNANAVINSFNSQLASMGFNKFVTGSYTSENRNYVYASMLRSAQTCISNSANSLATVQNAVVRLGETQYTDGVKEAIGSSMNAYIEGAAAVGRLNAYRLILLGASSTYSGSYSSVSSAYNSLYNIITCNAEAAGNTLNRYTADTNIAITSARSNATKIGNAIAKAF